MRHLLIGSVAAAATISLAACAPASEPTIDEISQQAVEDTANPVPVVPSLDVVWTIDGFESPEGVARAPDGSLFISNVTGEGAVKDGTGYVSRISMAGEVIDQKWVEGLNGPKGMAVLDGVLYVSDIDEVARFDIETGEALGVLPVEGAGFLNDATVWNDVVHVSDSRTGTIHRVVGTDVETVIRSEELGGVNGLLGQGDHMLVSTMDGGALLALNGDGKLDTLCEGMENADGIGPVAGGGYLVSSWPGQIWYCDGDTGAETELLNTVDDTIFQNDLTVFGDTVIVPNWQPGTVTAYRVTPATP